MFDVMKERCDECLFGPNKIVGNARRAQILRQCKVGDGHFVCHKATMKGCDACCRGFYDANPGATNLMRIAERLDAVKFVSEEEL